MTESYGTITITDTTDIAKIENWYLASNKSSGVTISESGWTTDVTNTNAVMTATKQYLWNYEKILGTGDVVINTTSPVIIGRYGQNGGTGAAGKGISSIDEYYQATDSTSNPGSNGWQKNTLVAPTSSNPYLWNYQVINYVNPTSTQGSYINARIIGVYGDKGDTGISVSSTIKYYQLATSKPSQPNNNAAIPSDWGTSEPTFDSSKLIYTLYTVIQTTYSNGNIVYSVVQVDSSFEAAKVAYQKAQTAQTNTNTVLTSANAQEQLIYISKAIGTTSVSANTTWVIDATGNQNIWTTKRPEYSKSYPVLFIATQRQTILQSGGTDCTCTTPTIDNTTTVIDGGNIITGSITANQINVTDLSTINANIGSITAGSLSKGNNFISLDNGTLEFKNASTFANSSHGIQWDGNNLNIKGSISASDISGSTITGSTIHGSTFEVATIKSGVVGDENTGAIINNYGDFVLKYYDFNDTNNHVYDLLKVDSTFASPILDFGGDLADFRIGHTDENSLIIDTHGYVISKKEYAITTGDMGEYIECAGRLLQSGRTLSFQIPYGIGTLGYYQPVIGSATVISIYYPGGVVASTSLESYGNAITEIRAYASDFGIRVVIIKSTAWISSYTSGCVTVLLHNLQMGSSLS